jgi:hypothetical protein
MNRPIVQIYRACWRKIRYATRAAAADDQPGMRYYHCEHCAGYHAATFAWQRCFHDALATALGSNPLPLTNGVPGDPATGRANSSRHMKHAGATPL